MPGLDWSHCTTKNIKKYWARNLAFHVTILTKNLISATVRILIIFVPKCLPNIFWWVYLPTEMIYLFVITVFLIYVCFCCNFVSFNINISTRTTLLMSLGNYTSWLSFSHYRQYQLLSILCLWLKYKKIALMDTRVSHFGKNLSNNIA